MPRDGSLVKIHKENPKIINRSKEYEVEEETSTNVYYLFLTFLKGLATKKWEFKFTWKF